MKKLFTNFYEKYDWAFWLLGVGYILYQLRGLLGLLGSVSGAASAAAAGATANVALSGHNATQKAKIKSVNPGASDADINRYETDVRGLAAALGHIPGVYSNFFFSDREAAFRIAGRYSRVITHKGQPDFTISKNGNRVQALRLDAQRLGVLYPFYSDLTGGRSLESDLDSAMQMPKSDNLMKFYNAYIR